MRLADLSHKKWFSWILVLILVVSNVLSYKIADSYFAKNGQSEQDEVKVESSMLGSGSRIIDWAKDILRFFRNP